jgi:hypothetical protein
VHSASLRCVVALGAFLTFAADRARAQSLPDAALPDEASSQTAESRDPADGKAPGDDRGIPGRHTPARYHFVSVEIPSSSGVLGLTTLTSIHNRGAFVGGFAAADVEGFLVSDRRGLERIRCPDVTFQTVPADINDAGIIAGFCDTRGFVRTRRGRFIFIEAPDAFYTEARGINDRNQVVGHYRLPTGFHGFVWEAGIFRRLDLSFADEPGLTLLPSRINNLGQIVGTAVDLTCGCNVRSFLADLRDGSVRAIAIPGSVTTLANDINDRGQIAGTYIDENDRRHGFILDRGHVATIDVPFAEASFTDVAGINDRGDVVGRYLVAEPVIANFGFVAIRTRKPGRNADPKRSQATTSDQEGSRPAGSAGMKP